MNDLLLHPETRKQLELLQTRPSHAIMITGGAGSGKRTIARMLLEDILGKDILAHPYVLQIAPVKNTITIEQIRELQNFIRLKTTGSGQIRRAILVEDAQLMGIEAQNALLKTLEEPPHDTILVLTAQADTRLKPTIYSRVQKIHVRPLARKHLTGLEQKFALDEIDKAYNLSDGQAGLLMALLENSHEHELTLAIAEAKNLLTSPVFERLTLIESIIKAKTDLHGLLGAMKRVARAALKAAVIRQDVTAQHEWHNRLKAILSAEKQLAGNTQSKLLLTNLFLSI